MDANNIEETLRQYFSDTNGITGLTLENTLIACGLDRMISKIDNNYTMIEKLFLTIANRYDKTSSIAALDEAIEGIMIGLQDEIAPKGIDIVIGILTITRQALTVHWIMQGMSELISKTKSN